MPKDPPIPPDKDPPPPEKHEESVEPDHGPENIEEVGEPFDGNFA